MDEGQKYKVAYCVQRMQTLHCVVVFLLLWLQVRVVAESDPARTMQDTKVSQWLLSSKGFVLCLSLKIKQIQREGERQTDRQRSRETKAERE